MYNIRGIKKLERFAMEFCNNISRLIGFDLLSVLGKIVYMQSAVMHKLFTSFYLISKHEFKKSPQLGRTDDLMSKCRIYL